MDSADAPFLSAAFIRNIASRRDGIAHEWYLAISSICSLIPDRRGAIRQFSELADRIIAFLTGPTQLEQEARAIGEGLAELHCIQPRVVDITWKLWTRQVADVATPTELAILYPRLVTLIYTLTSGYFDKAREIALAEQEQIRQALVFHVEKVSQELREYQLHLEEILDERTQELHAKEEQYRLISETSMLGIYQLDSSGSFIFLNEAFSKIVGYSREELLGRSIRQVFNPDDLPKIEELRGTLYAVGSLTVNFRLKHKEGHPIHTVIRIVVIPMDRQQVFTGFVADVTDQTRTEDALRASEERYRTLAESARDLILTTNREHLITYANSFAADHMGAKPDQVAGQPSSLFFGRKSGKVLDAAIDSVFHSGTDVRLEEQLEFKSGPAWLSLSLVPLKDASGNVASVLMLGKDISDLKKTEHALLLAKSDLEDRVRERTASLAASQMRSRDLARQVITAQEEERRRLARELHDQSGQALISIKYEMDSLLKDLQADSKPARRRISKMMASIDQTVQQIREISQNLRPPILDIAGINLSLEEYCAELAKKTSLAIKYHGSELPGLDAEIGISLFRIVQELLTNIMKHSGATKATINLRHDDDVIVLAVADNGKGLKKKSPRKGFGLLGIQERLDILGGSLMIHSENGGGTKITISIPWKGPTE